MPYYTTIRDYLEFTYFFAAPILAFFAWRMLTQLKIGSDQVKAATEQIITSKKIAATHAKREAIKIATEQSNYFAKEIIPNINKFHKLKGQNKYPILMKTEVIEDWPSVQCKIQNIPSLIAEVESNNCLVLNILNQLEGLAMYFVCGIADSNSAYGPLSSSFCDNVKIFFPYMILVNDKFNQFGNILKLYGAWSARSKAENAMKEISKQKEYLSKIKVPEVQTFGTDPSC